MVDMRPTPNGDRNVFGTKLNAWISTVIKSTGGLRDDIVTAVRDGLALQTDMDQVQEDVNALDMVTTTQGGKITILEGEMDDVEEDISTHSGDTANPHAVTKTQVGLGNVPDVDATARANHTGEQAISTVTGLQSALDGKALDMDLTAEKEKIVALTPGKAEMVTTDDNGDPIKIRIAKTPEMYGGKGNYNPDTDTGDDDTDAVLAWIDDLLDGEVGEFPPGKFYLCTDKIVLKKWTHLVGHGRNSGIFFRFTEDAATTNGLVLVEEEYSTWDNIFNGHLENFGVYCRATPDVQETVAGRAAIKGTYIQKNRINITIGGHWKMLMDVSMSDADWAAGPGIGGDDWDNGGGVEESQITLEHDRRGFPGYTYVPWAAELGVRNRGWSNSTEYLLKLRLLTKSAGWFEGSYGGANSQLNVRGTIQGISMTEEEPALYVKYGTGLDVSRLYQEANGGGTVLEDITSGQVTDCGGSLDLINCKDVYLARIKPGPITIDADSRRIELGAGLHNVTNHSQSARYTELTQRTLAVQTHSDAGITTHPANVLVNGNFQRFLVSLTDNNVWGTTNSNYKATYCGVGQTDTTQTLGASNCIKLEKRAGGQHPTFRYDLFPAGSLAGHLGRTVFFACKYKMVSGRFQLQGDSIGEDVKYHIPVQTEGIPCENGFLRYVRAFIVTQDMIDDGMFFALHFPDYSSEASVFYLSEVMIGLGPGAPALYQPCTTVFGRSDIYLESSRLIMEGFGAPVSGGDPISGYVYQRGDRVIDITPTAAAEIGWVCVTGGTPGTWKAYGTIAS